MLLRSFTDQIMLTLAAKMQPYRIKSSWRFSTYVSGWTVQRWMLDPVGHVSWPHHASVLHDSTFVFSCVVHGHVYSSRHTTSRCHFLRPSCKILMFSLKSHDIFFVVQLASVTLSGNLYCLSTRSTQVTIWSPELFLFCFSFSSPVVFLPLHRSCYIHQHDLSSACERLPTSQPAFNPLTTEVFCICRLILYWNATNTSRGRTQDSRTQQ